MFNSIYQLLLEKKLDAIWDVLEKCISQTDVAMLDVLNFWVGGTTNVKTFYEHLKELIDFKERRYYRSFDRNAPIKRQQFALTAKVELAVNKRLISEHRARFGGFAVTLLGIDRGDS